MSHLECFQQARREDGFAIRKEEYAGTCLGMDERSWAATLLTRRDGTCGQASHARIIERKAALFRNHTGTRTAALFPWVTGFVERAAEQYWLAIAAGGKSDPAIYESALRQLNANRAKPALLRGAECLAIEDSRTGTQAGLQAGMRALALATTYPASQLTDVHLVLPALVGVDPADLASRLF